MSEKRGSWMIRLVMALGLIAFLGIGFVPLLNGVFEATQATTQPSVAPTPTATTPNKADLEAQARGYELILQREPDNETALRGLLEMRLKLQELPGAIAALEKLVKLKPENTYYSILLAQSKQYTGDREGAAQVYRTLLTSEPGNIYALEGLVNLLQQEKRPEAAIGLLQDTLKTAVQTNQIKPRSVDVVAVQVILGKVYAQQKRYEEAIAVFDEAIKSDAKNFEPLLAKALVLQLQGKNDDAKPLFTTAAQLAPPQYRDQINDLSKGSPSPTPSPTLAPEKPLVAPIQ